MTKATAGLELDGLAALRDTLTNVAPKEAEKIADETVYGVAKRVEGILFRRLQNNSDSGRLAHSVFTIRKKPQQGMLESQVRGGATAPYLLMQEFGTSRTEAQPAINPTVEEVRPDLPAIYKQEFADKLGETLARKARKR